MIAAVKAKGRTVIENAAREERGIPWVLDGANADDRGDYRPGMRALSEFSAVRSPLLEAGMTKAEVRAAARAMGLFTWNKPARACLASRIPYGEPVTAEALRRVEAAERFLADILPPATQFRVRAHGDLARVEAECRDLLLYHNEEPARFYHLAN